MSTHMSIHMSIHMHIHMSVHRLDFVLLACLCVVAVSSLAFQAGGSDQTALDSLSRFRSTWESGVLQHVSYCRISF